MTILLDESVPRVVKIRLHEFSIATVQEMGWTGMKNGDLLAAASQQFTVLITADKNLRYQQNLKDHRLSIIVLPTNQVSLVVTLLPVIQDILRAIQLGDLIHIPLP